VSTLSNGDVGAKRPRCVSAHEEPAASTTPCRIVLALTLLSFVIHFWGIRKDLPFTPETDEPIFVGIAVQMATSGNMNPAWFGNPGSTVLYPLVPIYRVWHLTTDRGMVFRSDPNLRAAYSSDPTKFVLLGRLLSISYAALSVPLVYRLGRLAFGQTEGLIGAWLSILCPIAVTHAQMVRTDSATVFFGMLALWMCLRAYEQPTKGNQVMAGVSIGLAIATKYYMGVLVVVLLMVDVMLLRRRAGREHGSRPLWTDMAAGAVAVLVGFALAAPYFFLDFGSALRDLRIETRSTHLGADGLSPLGNLGWYTGTAIPDSLDWPRGLLALGGLALVLRRPRPKQKLLIGFLAAFLVGISLSPLHWQRWLIPVLPLLGLVAGHALTAIGRQFRLSLQTSTSITLAMLLLVSVHPAYQLVLMGIRQSNPSTRVLAREWILVNLPVGCSIAEEAYTAPLAGTGFVVLQKWSLAEWTVEDYGREGYSYLILSSAMYDRYLAEPERYPSQVSFYTTLFDRGRLLQKFEPSTTRGGPVIRIYELGDH